MPRRGSGGNGVAQSGEVKIKMWWVTDPEIPQMVALGIVAQWEMKKQKGWCSEGILWSPGEIPTLKSQV